MKGLRPLLSRKAEARRGRLQIFPDENTLLNEMRTHEIDMAIHVGLNVNGPLCRTFRAS
jgi:hypothetical protein